MVRVWRMAVISLCENMNKLTTEELVRRITQSKNVIFEASLCLGMFRATHFLRFGGKKLFDIGIDSKQITWLHSKFVKFYNKSYWIIDQIV